MKDDKKKIVVLGVLLAVMLAVGAFTFMGGGSSQPTVAADPAAGSGTGEVVKVNANGETATDTSAGAVPELKGEELPKNPLYAADLPQRDPFVTNLAGAGSRSGFVNPQPVTAPVQRAPRTTSYPSVAPYVPRMTGSLPDAGSVTITSTGPDPSQFGYTVSGVITGGGKPAAVFTDSSGNQRLVPVGGSLDGDSKVVAIDRGNVTIEHRGKKQRLSLGGNPK
jgi:hypothetical protein